VKKTSRRLADGREIVYYDESPTHERNAEDTRDLPARSASTELRYDPLLSTWVMYASHRQDRTYLPAADACPLCPSKPGHPTEVPEADYEVVVFENRFPALTGPGRCEVVCYTADHGSSFAKLSLERTNLVLDALTDRTTALSTLPGVEQVFCFENSGADIGVTLLHPHGQIYAYPFVTPRTEKMLASTEAHELRTGRNLFDEILDKEIAAGSRVVLRTGQWTAFVPEAARWPYEIHCYPNDRVPDLAALGGEARSELPEVLHDLYGRFARLFDKPAPYIAGWHQAPVRQGRSQFALHLELFTSRRSNDKLKFLAGSESGMDAFANDIIPEAAAERLRELGPPPV
jgi:UDPglucose--hexose-1-phosphate uridylyltransferase